MQWSNGSGTYGANFDYGLGGLVSGGIQGIMNYLSQADQQRYDRRMQELMLSREDNAVQRRVADLRAAGLSPTLAAGSSAGAGTVVKSSAPESKINALQESLGLKQQALALQAQRAQINQVEAKTELDKQKKDFLDQLNPETLTAKKNTNEMFSSTRDYIVEGRRLDNEVKKLGIEKGKVEKAILEYKKEWERIYNSEGVIRTRAQRLKLENDAKQAAIDLVKKNHEINSWNLKWYIQQNIPTQFSGDTLWKATNEITNILNKGVAGASEAITNWWNSMFPPEE